MEPGSWQLSWDIVTTIGMYYSVNESSLTSIGCSNEVRGGHWSDVPDNGVSVLWLEIAWAGHPCDCWSQNCRQSWRYTPVAWCRPSHFHRHLTQVRTMHQLFVFPHSMNSPYKYITISRQRRVIAAWRILRHRRCTWSVNMVSHRASYT